jgi:hypothetical protein
VKQTRTVTAHHTPAEKAGPRIDTNDEHASADFAPISRAAPP